jgi:hypothetical protein
MVIWDGIRMFYFEGMDLGGMVKGLEGGSWKDGDGMDGFCLSFEDISLFIIARDGTWL